MLETQFIIKDTENTQEVKHTSQEKLLRIKEEINREKPKTSNSPFKIQKRTRNPSIYQDPERKQNIYLNRNSCSSRGTSPQKNKKEKENEEHTIYPCLHLIVV